MHQADLIDDAPVSESTMSSSALRFAWLVVPLGLAILLLLGGVLITPDQWASIFQTDLAFPTIQHPDRPTALEGARLLRIMLLVASGGLLAATLVFHRIGAPSPARHEQDDYTSRELWIIVTLMGFGLLLRLLPLTQSLWYDEIAMWVDYAMRGPGWIVGTYYDPANHILYSLLAWCSTELLGGDGFALRLPALLFSLGAIITMYGCARCAAGKRAALFAGLLASCLPVTILEGVEARGYSMMIFFSTLACWLLLSIQKEHAAWKWLTYACVCALGIWAHMTTVFIPAGHGVWLLWRFIKHREIRFAMCGFFALALAALLTVTLYAPVIPQILSIRGTFAASDGDEPGLLGPEGLHTLLQLGGSWTAISAIPGLFLLLVGLISIRKNAVCRSALALSLLGLPLFIGAVIIADSWMYARFTLFALPGAILAMALGIEFFTRRSKKLGLLMLALMLAASTGDLYRRPSKQPLREAADHVRKSVQPGERVLVIGLAHRVMEMYRGDLEMSHSLFHGRDLDEALRQVEPQWIIMLYPRNVSAEHFASLQELGFIESRRFRGWVDWDNGDVLIWQRRSSP